MKASEKYPGDTSLILGIARVYDALNDLSNGVQYYKKVLHYDPSHIEALSCLASHHFYTDQPELSLRLYRRLLQSGVTGSVELWNNLALSCFYSGQYDMTLGCLERAMNGAGDENAADVWYVLVLVAALSAEPSLDVVWCGVV
jgi:tetratricopeptide repeat protein 8